MGCVVPAFRRQFFIPVLCGALIIHGRIGQAQEPALSGPQASVRFEEQSPTIWVGKVGDGYKRWAKEFTASMGAGFGMKVITTRENHDWALANLEYGCMVSDVVGQGHWYRGNWEILGQLFGGFQFYPDTAYVISGGPLFRYNFATGSRWMPYLEVGAGIAATDIRNGDLSTTFEFNLQAGAGLHYFLKDDLALTFQYRFIHLSNAGLEFPNTGVNNSTFLLGVSWFF
jgi:lipid A 3-O-deacylase